METLRLPAAETQSTCAAVVERYIDAWNRHDAEGLLSTFAEGGTYRDPMCPEGLSGRAIVGHATALFEAFPDVTFERVGIVPADPATGTVAFRWRMRGTNTGAFRGTRPTGSSIDLPGVDFLVVDGGLIRSLKGYWDQTSLVEQLGLQALVLPRRIGPVSFGYAMRMPSDRRTRPGALSLTWLDVRSDEEVRMVQAFTRDKLLPALAASPGFVGFTSGGVDRRMYTVTAWEGPEDAARMATGAAAHAEAVRWFHRPDGPASRFWSSVWVPHHLGDYKLRCPSCGRVVDGEGGATRCPQCDTLLPEQSPYW